MCKSSLGMKVSYELFTLLDYCLGSPTDANLMSYYYSSNKVGVILMLTRCFFTQMSIISVSRFALSGFFL
jgi:hypothetical protein